MQRSVRRTELDSEQSSPSPSPQPELLAKLKSLHDLDFVDTHPTIIDEDVEDHVGEEDLAFNLFAPTSKSEQKDVKIRLRSPTPDTKHPGFVQPERALQYYVATSTKHQQASYVDAALSGPQIIRLATMKWPGMAYPWRMIHLQQSALSKSMRATIEPSSLLLSNDEHGTKRRRKGKQARIKLRRRHAVAKLEEDEKKAALEAKEAALQATRTRKNREKKQRQRARDRAKKAAATTDEAQATDEVPVG